MAKGSRLARIVEYFKSGELEEVKYVYQRAGEIVSERQTPMTIQKKLALGGRKKRRTKVQIEEANRQADNPVVTVASAAVAGE
jgi:hypothetical protein